MVRKFTYRGYSVSELQEMPMDDFINLLPSRQRRSLSRGLTRRKKHLLEKTRKVRRALKKGKRIVLRTHLRSMVVLPEMVGLTIGIYNGREFIETLITPECIGHFFGEFAPTHKRVIHGNPGIGATRSSQYVPLK